MDRYLPRVADRELVSRLAAAGAVLIEGPKASGKTATAVRMARTVYRFDVDANARSAVSLNPEALFAGATPILFDEWQVEPDLWNLVRRQVDDRAEAGLFILTGSATPRDDINRHSGAGRVGTIRMRPMSLFESGHSNGEVSLADLFDGAAPTSQGNGMTVPDLVERIVVGGWPGLLGASEDDARVWAGDYLRQLVQVDIPALGHRRNPRSLDRLIEALARGVGTPTKQSVLAADVGGQDGPIAKETLAAYLDALDRLMLLDNSQAWRPQMRSRTRLRAAPVRYFVDPSIACAALDVGSAELLADLNSAGLHFEALVVRDLRVYAQPLRGTIDSWRDANGREVDAVVRLPGGRWGAFEIKLGPAAVDGAAENLVKFAASVDHAKHGAPVVLGVITSTGYAGRRPDGVHVIPITTLGP